MDADYSAQIVKVIHLLGTPGFSTLNTYDKVHEVISVGRVNYSYFIPDSYSVTMSKLSFSLAVNTKPKTMVSATNSLRVAPGLTPITGRFLLGILTDLYKWHQDEQLFLNDNRTKGAKVSYLPGFMLRFSNRGTVAADDVIKWPEFRGVCKKWHRKLLKVRLRKSLISLAYINDIARSASSSA